jgi:hypothetical protein
MTTGELIERLQHLPSDLQVILAADTEGKAYSPVAALQVGLYVADSGALGSFEGVPSGDANAVVLLPARRVPDDGQLWSWSSDR